MKPRTDWCECSTHKTYLNDQASLLAVGELDELHFGVSSAFIADRFIRSGHELGSDVERRVSVESESLQAELQVKWLVWTTAKSFLSVSVDFELLGIKAHVDFDLKNQTDHGELNKMKTVSKKASNTGVQKSM